MKVLIISMVIFCGICKANMAFAQSDTVGLAKKIDTISKVFDIYKKDLVFNKKPKVGKKAKNEWDTLAYNPKMLNMFMANSIGTYLASSKDISLQKYYAVLDQDETSLFLGYNFMFIPNKLHRLKHIANIGIKTDLSKNFSSFTKDGNVNPELALNLKYTYICRGKIKFYKKHRDAIDNYRTNFLKDKYKKELAPYALSDTDTNKNENTALEAKLKYADTVFDKKEKEELIEDEFNSQYEKIATDEETFIKDNKMFNSIVSNWFTGQVYIPAGNKEYKFSPATTIFATTDERFYNFKASALWTRMQKWSSKRTLYTTLQLSGYNLNNVITEDVKAYKFETIANQGGNNQTVEDSKDAYVGVYKQDFATSIKGEVVFFFLKDVAGVSMAAELVMGGKFNARNWKMAIPISLKDKEGKPTINFEFQFKEVYKTHSLGIAVGYAFGKYFD